MFPESKIVDAMMFVGIPRRRVQATRWYLQVVKFRYRAHLTKNRWVQTIGGTAMAVIGFVADTQQWQIDPKILYALSAVFFLWALVKTFHDVRLERDQSNAQLKEHRDCQAIADYLTKQHDYGIHQLLHKPPKTVDDLPQWNRWVENWNEAIFVELEKLLCTPQDLNHVRTISILDVTGGLPEPQKRLEDWLEGLATT